MPAFPGADVLKVVAAALTVVVILGLAVYKARQRIQADDTNEKSGEERQQVDEVQRRDYSISLRSRYSRLPLPARLVTLGMLVLGVLFAAELYHFFKTGSPHQVWFSSYAQFAGAILVSSASAVVWERKRARTEGQINSVVESPPDEGGEIRTRKRTVAFNTADVVDTDDGKVAYEYTEGRVYGLYRRPKSLVENRKTRDFNQPSDDKIGYLIPGRAQWFDDGTVQFRTQGWVPVDDPTKPYDFKPRSSFTVSREDKYQYETDMEVLGNQNEHLRIRLASAHEALRKAEREFNTRFEEEIQTIEDTMDRLGKHAGGQEMNQYKLNQQQQRPGHSPRDGQPDEQDGRDELSAGRSGERRNGRGRGRGGGR